MSKVALILQGPWHTQWLTQIDQYLKVFDEIVISTYASPDLLQWVVSTDLANIRVVINDLWIPRGYDNSGNIFYQVKTTASALQSVQSQYVVKSRLDESYSNMQLIKDTILANPDRITSINLFFRKNSHISYHISDHVFGGKTSAVKAAFDGIMDMCSVSKIELLKLFSGFYHAEVMITWNLLRAAKVDLFKDSILDHMTKNIKIVPIQSLEPFVFGGSWATPWTTIEQCYDNGSNPLYQTVEEYINCDD